MPVSESKSKDVEYMSANLKKLTEDRHQFAIQHGFAWKRPEHFKNCVVIRWKHRKRKDPDFIDYQRINEYVDFAHGICDKFDLWDDRHVLLSIDLCLSKVGIYCFYSWNSQAWAIPNSNGEIKEYVLTHLPAWAHIVEKA